ncbi:MAG: oxaloacetate decarboxylase [Lachnospiraceae bacterium]|mgnify:CR=1 FL=1|jgi:hypothetical protein|uniref:oxaloacetate decarboxylase n=1 Tax=Roseburia sp. 1XD42-69 TaxID=2320088 RepID=UPI000EA1FF0F|nr:oxaloacetate decarboxylase [Roseburia sp. 1XD42-69]MCI8875344.1 oxaloacetate decarboxylase [Lachnospiraceae bacterium]MCX4320219.1 oxaloacetate decarboxylase [Lachnospiraceae bacterium]RKJ66150.1 oxaloacetate decarboxylase [Roseburia sp. 1XD42-69]
MRKVWAGIIGGLGILCMGISLVGEYVKHKKTASMSFTVIGAEDGPTSVFLVGTLGDLRTFQLVFAGAGLFLLVVYLILLLIERSS